MVFWFFGYPGIGKDFLATKLSRLVAIPHINADDFLTATDKKKLIKGTFTQQDRIKKLKRIITYINKLLPKHPSLVAADSLPDNLSRQLLFDTFAPEITFIYVHAPRKIHLSRLKARKEHFFTMDLLDAWIKKHWKPIDIPYISFQNSEGAEPKIEKKLLAIYNATSRIT